MSRHEPDWLSLCCGLIFLGLGVAYLVASLADIDIQAVWALPGLLLALGAAGLVGTARRPRRGRR